MIPDPAGYLRTWSREFSARSDRVRHLIGSAHWLSDGHHKESILREFLERYLPPHLTVSRGFIRGGSDHSDVSTEIDVLVTDHHRHPPFLSEFDLTICSPDSTRAVVEVKSQFNGKNAKKALGSLAGVKSLLYKKLEIPDQWSCAFFYNLTEGSDETTIQNNLSSSVDQILRMGHRRTDISPARLVPDCVVCLDHFVAFLSACDTSVQVRYFPTKELSGALAILDLFSCIRTSISPGSRSEIDDMLEELGCDQPTKFSVSRGEV